jgi:modulator of FtsH protease
VFAYDPAEWSDLFVATAGASAALAGLVFVAVSINIERIIKYPGLPERSLETLLFLVLVLLLSVVCLIPGQGHVALGLELLLVSLAIGGYVSQLPLVQGGSRDRRRERWGVRVTATVPFLIGSISLLVSVGGGLYWVAGGVVFAIAGAVANAWVLLVEILR